MQNRLTCLAIVLLCLFCTTPAMGGQAEEIEIRRSPNQKTAYMLNSPQMKGLVDIMNFNFKQVSTQHGWEVQVFAKVLSEQTIAAAEIRFIMFDAFGEDPKPLVSRCFDSTTCTRRPQNMSKNTQGLWEFSVPKEYPIYGMGFVYVGRVKFEDGSVIAVDQEACADAVLAFMSQH